MRRDVVALIVVGIFMIGMASAALTPFLSNWINSEFNINGPVFYTASENTLVINGEPSSGSWNQLSNSDGYVQRQWTMSDEDALGGIDFYKPALDFYIRYQIESNYSLPEGIGVEFGFYNIYEQKRPICNFVYLGLEENGTLEYTCPESGYLDYELIDIDKFYYSFEPQTSKGFEIKTSETYVEITEELTE